MARIPLPSLQQLAKAGLAIGVPVGATAAFNAFTGKPEQTRMAGSPPVETLPPPPPIAPDSGAGWTGGTTSQAEAPPAPGTEQTGSLLDIFEKIIQAQERAGQRAGAEYGPRVAIDVEAFKQRAAVAQANALERMEAKTQRDVELGTIESWTKVTQAQIQRDTELARAMMQTAMVMGVPNANLIAATAPIAQQATAAFKPGQAVF